MQIHHQEIRTIIAAADSTFKYVEYGLLSQLLVIGYLEF